MPWIVASDVPPLGENGGEQAGGDREQDGGDGRSRRDFDPHRPVPADAGERRQRERREREQLRGKTKLTEAGQEGGEQPVDAAVAVSEEAVLADWSRIELVDRAQVGRRASHWARPIARSRRAHASARSGSCTFPVAPRTLDDGDPREPHTPGRSLAKSKCGERQDECHSAQVERRHPDLGVSARQSDRAVPSRCSLRIEHPRCWARSVRSAGGARC